jgi:hypothetical protein
VTTSAATLDAIAGRVRGASERTDVEQTPTMQIIVVRQNRCR